MKFARKVLAMNPATCLYACMARSVRNYAISVVLRMAIHAGTIQRVLEDKPIQELSQDKAGVPNHA